MGNLSRTELLERIYDAIRISGWNTIYTPVPDTQPFKIQIFSGEEILRLRIYIWNISHGGGYMRPEHEYRIQVHVPKFETETGWITLILGWWDEGKVFAGFDLKKHNGDLGKSASIQIRRESLEKAAINGFAPSDKGNQEIAIAFRPDLFVNYAKNLSSFHSFGENRPDLEILESMAQNEDQLQNNELLQAVSNPRKRDYIIVNKVLRDSSFKRRVLSSYSYQCAFCDLQLDLIEAAHIIPVSYERSTDETKNGIALCALHHKAYDNSLITFNEKYQIIINSQKIDILHQSHHDGKLSEFIQKLRPVINVPAETRDRPLVDYVIRANSLRGW